MTGVQTCALPISPQGKCVFYEEKKKSTQVDNTLNNSEPEPKKNRIVIKYGETILLSAEEGSPNYEDIMRMPDKSIRQYRDREFVLYRNGDWLNVYVKAGFYGGEGITAHQNYRRLFGMPYPKNGTEGVNQ